MFDTQLLSAFAAVVEAGSFTRAALRLGMTQSSVSQQIRRLEAQLGRALLVRDTHSVALTPAGEALLPHAAGILDAIDAAEQALSARALTGEVALGVAEDFATARLAAALRRFRRVHDAVRLRVETDLSGALLARLDKGEFDLVLAKEGRTRPDGVTMRPLGEDRLVWVGAPGEMALADTRPLKLALHPEPSVTRSVVLEALREAEIEADIVHGSVGISGLRAGILAGLGISAFGASLVPSGLIPLDAARYGLPALPSLRFILAQSTEQPRDEVEALANAMISEGLVT